MDRKAENRNAGPLSLSVDVEKYAHHLENSGMSEEEKRLFLETLWAILIQFVDLGFGIHPVQDSCGKPQENASNPALAAPDGVDCRNTVNFNKLSAADSEHLAAESESPS